MPQILGVGGEPFCFIEQALRHRRIGCCKIVGNRRMKCEAIPSHGMLPAKSQSLGNFFTGHTRTLREGGLETRPQRIPQRKPQIGIAEQFTEPIIDQSSHQLSDLFGRQRREFHIRRIRRRRARLQPGCLLRGQLGFEPPDEQSEPVLFGLRDGQKFHPNAM